MKQSQRFLLPLILFSTNVQTAPIGDQFSRSTELVDRNDVISLASDDKGGRVPFTTGWFESQKYIIEELAPIAEGLLGEGEYRQEISSFSGTGSNILGLIRGSELPNEYVIIGAHYDGIRLNDGCNASKTAESDICNGATANAVGVAVVLGIGRAIAALPTPPRRSVILAFWDLDTTLLGTFYYTIDQVVPLSRTVAYLNFEVMGYNLSPIFRDYSAAIGADTGGQELEDLLDKAIESEEELDMIRLGSAFDRGGSHTYFRDPPGDEDPIPIVWFNDGPGGCYRTTGDELRIVDFDKANKQARIGLNMTLEIADTTTPPTYDENLTYSANTREIIALSRVIIMAFIFDFSVVRRAFFGLLSDLYSGTDFENALNNNLPKVECDSF